MLIAELRLSEGQRAPGFSVLEALLAALFVGGGVLFRRRLATEASDATRLGLGALAAAVIAALGSGLAFALDGGALTVSLAILASASASTSRKLELDIPVLRWCLVGLGLLILAPAICFALAARWMRRGG
jgi:hypothetical protein